MDGARDRVSAFARDGARVAPVRETTPTPGLGRRAPVDAGQTTDRCRISRDRGARDFLRVAVRTGVRHSAPIQVTDRTRGNAPALTGDRAQGELKVSTGVPPFGVTGGAGEAAARPSGRGRTAIGSRAVRPLCGGLVRAFRGEGHECWAQGAGTTGREPTGRVTECVPLTVPVIVPQSRPHGERHAAARALAAGGPATRTGPPGQAEGMCRSAPLDEAVRTGGERWGLRGPGDGAERAARLPDRPASPDPRTGPDAHADPAAASRTGGSGTCVSR